MLKYMYWGNYNFYQEVVGYEHGVKGNTGIF